MTTRPLLIPHKRPLLSSNSQNDKENPKKTKSVPKVLNPSAVAADTRMKKPFPCALDKYTEAQEPEENQPEPIKVSFATPPQPFLDPPVWQAMLKRAREATNTNAPGNGNEQSGPSETADQRRQRQDREAEYGSMAIRGRSNISGRGKRREARRY
ncbi:hypothetical protein N7520_008741 [Penicillium odoratum]|uniref:uncharacterized protein n=1 Tax=Penicillium odoratum TaxID=1167516 RepID=UPI002548538D|nr:uncharacterized protein N7520_008741 [Penicillium odoratum]KAJ5751824.1 hypothetical protein N7520_008741 [Penicillium odoratum]